MTFAASCELFHDRCRSDTIPVSSDVAVAALLKRRSELEGELEALKARKSTMPADQYDADLERILLELAKVSRQIRAKS